MGFSPAACSALQRRQDAGHAGFVVQVARAHETVDHFHARIKGDKIAHLDAQRAGFLGVVTTCASRRTSMVIGGAFGLADLSADNVRGGLGQQDAAADLFPRAGENGAAFAFDRVPGVAADLGQRQPAVGFDLFDHGAERIDVGGQGARSIVFSPGQGDQQAPLCVRWVLIPENCENAFSVKAMAGSANPVGLGVFNSSVKNEIRPFSSTFGNCHNTSSECSSFVIADDLAQLRR